MEHVEKTGYEEISIKLDKRLSDVEALTFLLFLSVGSFTILVKNLFQHEWINFTLAVIFLTAISFLLNRILTVAISLSFQWTKKVAEFYYIHKKVLLSLTRVLSIVIGVFCAKILAGWDWGTTAIGLIISIIANVISAKLS